MTVVSWPDLITGSVLSVDGRLRAPVDREIRHQVRTLLRRGERHIILDLTRVSSIDAAGVGELVRAHNMARALSGAVRVVNPNRRVRHAIVRAGLDAFLLKERGVRPLLPGLPFRSTSSKRFHNS
jgi:anti-anti-sigma factor